MKPSTTVEKMNQYELMLILRPDFDTEPQAETLKNVSEIIEKTKGKLKSQDLWGKRKLEYSIKGFSSGLYVIFSFQTDPSNIKSLNDKLKLQENIIRFMITKK